ALYVDLQGVASSQPPALSTQVVESH
ncbi:hypothetical protein A2U01_0087386, partial [Trifolium medium]|nr:hypothetical protein [Trifolium medium]